MKAGGGVDSSDVGDGGGLGDVGGSDELIDGDGETKSPTFVYDTHIENQS